MIHILAIIFSLTVFATEPQEAYRMATQNKALFVDVREIQEIQNGMIDLAIWFPKSELLRDEELMADFLVMAKDKKVFVYCQGGRRAAVCTEFLKRKGVDSENIGGYDELKKELPTKSLREMVNRRQECRVTPSNKSVEESP